jgi:hypothetical protein
MSGTRRLLALALCGVTLLTALAVSRSPVAAEEKKSDPALERTRKQVRMLDDIYKSAIVLITDNYVTEESDLAAGDAFQALFKVVKDKGYHEVRLLDATGEPYDDENTPRPGFETKAVKELKSGKDWYEEQTQEDGQRYLHVATPLPVVLRKCTICHAHYADVPEGQIIGAVGYKLKIE